MNSTGKRMTPQGPLLTEATARIQMTVEVSVSGSWSADCTVEQVYRQAASDALAKVSRLIGKEGRVYDPKVTAVFADRVM